MKKHLSTIILVFVFLVGLSVVLYPTVSDYWNSRTQTRAIAAYQDSMKDMKPEDYTAYFEAAEDYNNRLRETPGAFTDPSLVAGYEDTLDISGTGVMGYITIEKIGVELPIYHGTEEGTLQIAAGHLEGSSLPIGGAGTHAVISAHRGLPSAKLFTNLDELEKGDTFTITVMNRVLTYEVDQIAIVEPEDTEKLQIVDGQDYCTLLTCTPYGINIHRLLVRGTRIATTEKPQIYVAAEAQRMDPLLVAPLVAVPMLLILLIYLLIRYRRKK